MKRVLIGITVALGMNCIVVCLCIKNIRTLNGQVSTLQEAVKRNHRTIRCVDKEISENQHGMNEEILNEIQKLREVNKKQQDFIDKANHDMYGEMKIGENP